MPYITLEKFFSYAAYHKHYYAMLPMHSHQKDEIFVAGLLQPNKIVGLLH